jgi:quercetin dioxygenase-like cupin family protein
MSNIGLILITVLVLRLSLVAQDSPVNHESAEHMAQAQMDGGHSSNHREPSAFKLEFENDTVQVVRIIIGPHEKIPMHDLTPRVVVLLTDQDLKVTLPNGESREEHHKAGESMWVPGGRHAGENLSEKPIEFIAVIPRGK